MRFKRGSNHIRMSPSRGTGAPPSGVIAGNGSRFFGTTHTTWASGSIPPPSALHYRNAANDFGDPNLAADLPEAEYMGGCS